MISITTILSYDLLTWGTSADPDQFELIPFSPEMWQVVDTDLLAALQE